MTMLSRWWSDKYGLPPCHELFVGQPAGVWMQEYFADLLDRRDEYIARMKDLSRKVGKQAQGQRQALLVQLNRLNALLGLPLDTLEADAGPQPDFIKRHEGYARRV